MLIVLDKINTSTNKTIQTMEYLERGSDDLLRMTSTQNKNWLDRILKHRHTFTIFSDLSTVITELEDLEKIVIIQESFFRIKSLFQILKEHKSRVVVIKEYQLYVSPPHRKGNTIHCAVGEANSNEVINLILDLLMELNCR